MNAAFGPSPRPPHSLPKRPQKPATTLGSLAQPDLSQLDHRAPSPTPGPRKLLRWLSLAHAKTLEGLHPLPGRHPFIK
jgi:hypothetical protein